MVVFSKIRKYISSGQSPRLIKATLSGGTARIINMIVVFATVPLTLNYLGQERYGLWMAVTSFAFILTTFADGGISNALITATAKANSEGGAAKVRKVIGSAAAIIIPIAILIILIGIIVIPLISWQWTLNLSSRPLAFEARAIMLVMIISIALGFIVNIILKTRAGLQQIPAVSAWDSLAALSILPALSLAIYLQLGIIWLVIAIVGTPLFVKATGSVLFLWHNPKFRARISDVDFSCSRDLLAGGSVFFMIALTQALAIQSDQILIANLASIKEVATYSIVQRLFTIPYILANFLFMAQWPAFSAAAAQGNYDWIKRTFWRTLGGTTFLAIILTGVLLVLHNPILSLWVGDKINPAILLVSTMSLYAVILTIIGACSTLLISLDIRKPQIWMSFTMLVVNLPLSIYLIPKIGAAGAIIGTALSYLLCMVIPYAFIIPKVLNKLTTEKVDSDV